MEQKYCLTCQEPVVDKSPPCPLQCRSPKCKAFQQKGLIDTRMIPIIWVLGGPGSGKGTQCDKMIAKYGFTHLSTGDLLREETKKGSERARALIDAMKKGELVSSDVVMDLLREAIMKHAAYAKGFLIDGYPREKSQGIAFELSIAPVTTILYFEASTDTLVKRLLGRAATSGRADDNAETIKLRIKTFLDNNQQILDQYPDRLNRINAENPVDTIFAEVQKILDPIMAGTIQSICAKEEKVHI